MEILKEIRHNTGKYPQCIGIVEKDDIETYASLIAVLLSGNTYVILNPHNPEDRNYTIIESTDIQLILQSDKSIISIEYPKHIKTIYTQSPEFKHSSQ